VTQRCTPASSTPSPTALPGRWTRRSSTCRKAFRQGVPLVLTDPNGVIAGHANLPFDPDHTLADTDSRIKQYVAVLQGEHPPIADSLIGKVYYGDPSVVRWLRIIPALQASMAAILLLAWVYIVRTRGDAARERLWAGMARESAHQLGTPLSSLAGWIELMEERARDESSAAAARTCAPTSIASTACPRFERIGREAKVRRRRRRRSSPASRHIRRGTDARQHDRVGRRGPGLPKVKGDAALSSGPSRCWRRTPSTPSRAAGACG
jgi:signal transduction histidine kinase